MAHSGSNSSLGAILKDLPQPEQLDTNVLKSELTKINFKLGYNPEKIQGLNSTHIYRTHTHTCALATGKVPPWPSTQLTHEGDLG